MASSSFDSLLAYLVDDVTCHVCLEVFEDPRELPCRHTLCCVCYTKMLADNKGLVTCPLCRAECHSPHGDLPVDYKVAKFVETYRKLQREQEKTSSVSPSVSVENTCFSECSLVGCKLQAVKTGPSSDLQLCSDHFDKDLEYFSIRCEKVKTSLRSRIDSYLAKEVSTWKSLLTSMEEVLEKVTEVFRELEKNLRLKREELEAELDARIRSLKDLISSYEEELTLLTQNETNLLNSLEENDFPKARQTMDVIELSLETKDSFSSAVPVRNISCLESLSSSITKSLNDCCFLESSSSGIRINATSDSAIGETINCIAVCSNTIGYFNRPFPDTEEVKRENLSSERKIAASVQKGNVGLEGVALPPEVLLVSFEMDKSGIYIYEEKLGKIVLIGFINLALTLDLNYFSLDSFNRRLILNFDCIYIRFHDLAGSFLFEIARTNFHHDGIVQLGFIVQVVSCVDRLLVHIEPGGQYIKPFAYTVDKYKPSVVFVCASDATSSLDVKGSFTADQLTDVSSSDSRIFCVSRTLGTLTVYCAQTFKSLVTLDLKLHGIESPMEVVSLSDHLVFIMDTSARLFTAAFSKDVATEPDIAEKKLSISPESKVSNYQQCRHIAIVSDRQRPTLFVCNSRQLECLSVGL